MRVPGSLVLPFLLLPFGAAASGDDGAHDWRKSAPIEEKVERLVEVMPGASNLMLEMGDRYRNLYWAARQGKWDFAAYQAEEIEQLIETLKITRPKRAATAAEFQARAYPRILDAAKSGDWPVFEKAYARGVHGLPRPERPRLRRPARRAGFGPLASVEHAVTRIGVRRPTRANRQTPDAFTAV
jgi:hypothetical protein